MAAPALKLAAAVTAVFYQRNVLHCGNITQVVACMAGLFLIHVDFEAITRKDSDKASAVE